MCAAGNFYVCQTEIKKCDLSQGGWCGSMDISFESMIIYKDYFSFFILFDSFNQSSSV